MAWQKIGMAMCRQKQFFSVRSVNRKKIMIGSFYGIGRKINIFMSLERHALQENFLCRMCCAQNKASICCSGNSAVNFKSVSPVNRCEHQPQNFQHCCCCLQTQFHLRFQSGCQQLAAVYPALHYANFNFLHIKNLFLKIICFLLTFYAKQFLKRFKVNILFQICVKNSQYSIKMS
jgi:hypothetical protein